MEIQPTQAADFLGVLQIAFDTVHLHLRLWLGKPLELDRIGIFLNAFHNPLVGIILSELIEPLRSLPSLSDNRPVFAVGVEIDAVSHFRQLAVKVFQRVGFGDGFVHRLPCHGVPRRSPLFFRLVKGVGLFLSAWMFDD